MRYLYIHYKCYFASSLLSGGLLKPSLSLNDCIKSYSLIFQSLSLSSSSITALASRSFNGSPKPSYNLIRSDASIYPFWSLSNMPNASYASWPVHCERFNRFTNSSKSTNPFPSASTSLIMSLSSSSDGYMPIYLKTKPSSLTVITPSWSESYKSKACLSASLSILIIVNWEESLFLNKILLINFNLCLFRFFFHRDLISIMIWLISGAISSKCFWTFYWNLFELAVW